MVVRAGAKVAGSLVDAARGRVAASTAAVVLLCRMMLLPLPLGCCKGAIKLALEFVSVINGVILI
eukprot:COSAG05_NODE_1163_length_5656_cov_2.387979_4_plen_65_part_00